MGRIPIYPARTGSTINRANGNQATAYFREDGHYVVIDNKTNEIIQVSNTNYRVGSGADDWKVDRDIKIDND